MRTAPWLLLLSAVALLVAPVTAPAQQASSVMDRVVARFKPGRPMSFTVLFETLETQHDLDFNTTVADVREKKDEKGRILIVTSELYTLGGVRQRFVFLIREGQLAVFDLHLEKAGEWESAPQDQFWFQMLEDRPPTDFLANGDAVLYARGACNQGRGAPARARATLALRSFHTETGRPLEY